MSDLRDLGDQVVIDGTAGGGQVLRNAVALSVATGRGVRVENIRGARPKPGLRPQHLAAVRAAAELCGAELAGAAVGSREIEFHPRKIKPPSRWQVEVGTAGSLTLVLQCLLPALAWAPRKSSLSLVGGTDVPFAPPFDYFTEVFLPAVREMGPAIEARCGVRGFYPKGGGEVEVRVEPAGRRAISWRERGEVVSVRGRAYSAGLPDHIVTRMRVSAANVLYEAGYRKLDIRLEVAEGGPGQGCGISLWAECEGGRRLGASALGRRSKRAEEVGEEAARELLAELASGAPVDSHLADQVIVWMAMAEGPSELIAPRITEHMVSAMQVAEMVSGARFETGEEGGVWVRCQPGDRARAAS